MPEGREERLWVCLDFGDSKAEQKGEKSRPLYCKSVLIHHLRSPLGWPAPARPQQESGALALKSVLNLAGCVRLPAR